jgi:Ca2+-transporting ATPase
VTDWHAKPADDVLRELGSAPDGLTAAEAARRRQQHGPNRLTVARPVSALRILWDQLRSVVVLLLVAAAVVSWLLGDRLEAAAVAAVLAINTLLGFATELRARRAMEALLRYEAPRATVFREGPRTVPSEDLVPGDVIGLRPGQAVPADGRLLESTDLRTVEAALTGESLPISKSAVVVLAPDTPLAERRNRVYTGTTVAAGTARACVTETGPRTELGRIGALVGEIREEQTPLERRLDALGRRLVWLALAVAALVAGLGALQGAPLGLVIETGIALAVAAVPEALPAVATIALAVGLRRMARRRALVRRLPAVEALGSTTVVCTDKTRTLTTGDMTAAWLWVDGREVEVASLATPQAATRRALETAALASRPQPAASTDDDARVADPVDLALLRMAAQAGVERDRLLADRPEAGQVPFSSERKLMASFHRGPGRLQAHVKGAPGRILDLSDRVVAGDGERALDADTRARISSANEELARRGLRVLALAAGAVDAPEEGAVRGLTFLGYVGLVDPPAPGVKETIATLRRAGLRTLMLTGDQRLTAEAIGRELGLLGAEDEVLDGRRLDQLGDADLRDAIARARAFSRVSPEHKLRIVSALQARGEVVAMLGDGVNDAPALRKADVGVAMGLRGTDVAKEASAVVLQDDRFETIGAAVEEGRVIYDNIRKFVFYLFSCNVAEVMVLLAAGVAGLPLPLLPLQILWLNMLTDTFPALALALEPAGHDVMARPPRPPQEAILSRRFLGRVMGHGLVITASTMAAFLWGLARAEPKATTMSFMTLALAQVFHLGNARRGPHVLSRAAARANPWAVGAVALALSLQVLALALPPLARVLRLQPLDAGEWAVVLGLSAVPAIVGQALKVRAARR